jgi:hypothetical protein
LACGSEAFVGVYLCDDVEGFSHDEVVFWYGLRINDGGRKDRGE